MYIYNVCKRFYQLELILITGQTGQERERNMQYFLVTHLKYKIRLSISDVLYSYL